MACKTCDWRQEAVAIYSIGEETVNQDFSGSNLASAVDVGWLKEADSFPNEAAI